MNLLHTISQPPWEKEGIHGEIITACNGRLSVCEVHDHSDTSSTHTTEEFLANAELIIRAPNLATVCEYAINHFKAIELSQPYPDQLRAREVQLLAALHRAISGKQV